MRPITIVLLAAALAIGVGTYALTWFTQVSGHSKIKLKPGEITVCVDGTCTTAKSDNADYDSTWLGVTNACKIAGGLGILACGAAAAMAQGRKTQLGTGGTAIKRNHVLVAALIGMGLTAASLLMVPMGLSSSTGIFVALAGYAVGAGGLYLLKDGAPPGLAPRPVS